MSASPSPVRGGRRAAAVLVAGLLLGWTGAHAENQPPAPHVPTLPTAPSRQHSPIPCPPGNTSKECAARRQTIQPMSQPNRVKLPDSLRQHEDDVFNRRFVPPGIMAFLDDRRLSAYTRSFLLDMARKPVADWTLAEAQMLTSVVPTLTEMKIPTRMLSEFYEFLGLDPTQLFTPQLGTDWQNQSVQFDKQNVSAQQQTDCLQLLGVGQSVDPAQVTLGQMAACSDRGGS